MEAAAAADAKRFCEFCSYFEGSSKEVEEHTITCEFKLRHEQAKLDFLKKMKKAKELKETNKQISESLEKVKLEYEISEIELAISKMKEEPPLSSTPWKPKKKKQTTDSDKGIQSTIVKQEPPSSDALLGGGVIEEFEEGKVDRLLQQVRADDLGGQGSKPKKKNNSKKNKPKKKNKNKHN